ncbi:unnamed protein product, partial [Scytosiphon promiscuus]
MQTSEEWDTRDAAGLRSLPPSSSSTSSSSSSSSSLESYDGLMHELLSMDTTAASQQQEERRQNQQEHEARSESDTASFDRTSGAAARGAAARPDDVATAPLAAQRDATQETAAGGRERAFEPLLRAPDAAVQAERGGSAELEEKGPDSQEDGEGGGGGNNIHGPPGGRTSGEEAAESLERLQSIGDRSMTTFPAFVGPFAPANDVSPLAMTPRGVEDRWGVGFAGAQRSEDSRGGGAGGGDGFTRGHRDSIGDAATMSGVPSLRDTATVRQRRWVDDLDGADGLDSASERKGFVSAHGSDGDEDGEGTDAAVVVSPTSTLPTDAAVRRPLGAAGDRGDRDDDDDGYAALLGAGGGGATSRTSIGGGARAGTSRGGGGRDDSGREVESTDGSPLSHAHAKERQWPGGRSGDDDASPSPASPPSSAVAAPAMGAAAAATPAVDAPHSALSRSPSPSPLPNAHDLSLDADLIVDASRPGAAVGDRSGGGWGREEEVLSPLEAPGWGSLAEYIEGTSSNSGGSAAAVWRDLSVEEQELILESAGGGRNGGSGGGGAGADGNVQATGVEQKGAAGTEGSAEVGLDRYGVRETGFSTAGDAVRDDRGEGRHQQEEPEGRMLFDGDEFDAGGGGGGGASPYAADESTGTAAAAAAAGEVRGEGDRQPNQDWGDTAVAAADLSGGGGAALGVGVGVGDGDGDLSWTTDNTGDPVGDRDDATQGLETQEAFLSTSGDGGAASRSDVLGQIFTRSSSSNSGGGGGNTFDPPAAAAAAGGEARGELPHEVGIDERGDISAESRLQFTPWPHTAGRSSSVGSSGHGTGTGTGGVDRSDGGGSGESENSPVARGSSRGDTGDSGGESARNDDGDARAWDGGDDRWSQSVSEDEEDGVSPLFPARAGAGAGRYGTGGTAGEDTVFTEDSLKFSETSLDSLAAGREGSARTRGATAGTAQPPVRRAGVAISWELGSADIPQAARTGAAGAAAAAGSARALPGARQSGAG